MSVHNLTCFLVDRLEYILIMISLFGFEILKEKTNFAAIFGSHMLENDSMLGVKELCFQMSGVHVTRID